MYFSKTPGTGGTIKNKAEDFLVEEIMPDGTILELNKKFELPGEGKFTHFILQKKDWSTSSALLETAKRLHIGHKRLNFAGTKDKTAISTQLVSAFDVPKEKITAIKIRDMQINGAWNAPDKVRLGALLGNRFTITVQGAANEERIPEIAEELQGKFPNFFGEQRFGSTRRNTHIIGQKILEEQFEEAVMVFLCDCGGEQNESAKHARQELESTKNFHDALKNYPKHLRLERKIIAYLEKSENYVGALKSLPRSTLLLFIHAFQSHLFNRMLEQRLGNIELEEGEYFCGETLGFPDTGKAESEGWICGKLIGCNSPVNSREMAALEEAGITKEHFKIPKIPEIASKGTYRTLLAPLKNFQYNGKFRFELPAGSYATVAMGEFTK
ncbi:tRNA pseudouridine(13) synthase TruD [Candidatus Micrarchaeota archaeon]|nr:tRNA pseudouridine(13) synthase TruD [Candidatus Micrarchaeota archaeon]